MLRNGLDPVEKKKKVWLILNKKNVPRGERGSFLYACLQILFFFVSLFTCNCLLVFLLSLFVILLLLSSLLLLLRGCCCFAFAMNFSQFYPWSLRVCILLIYFFPWKNCLYLFGVASFRTQLPGKFNRLVFVRWV